MINKLELEFNGTGEVSEFKFIQIKSNEYSKIYKVFNEFGDSWYEVFETKVVPLCLDFENRIYSETEFKEAYPKSRDFGIWAYTTKDANRATAISFEIDNKKQKDDRT